MTASKPGEAARLSVIAARYAVGHTTQTVGYVTGEQLNQEKPIISSLFLEMREKARMIADAAGRYGKSVEPQEWEKLFKAVGYYAKRAGPNEYDASAEIWDNMTDRTLQPIAEGILAYEFEKIRSNQRTSLTEVLQKRMRQLRETMEC